MSASLRDNALEASIRAACKQLRLPTIGARAGRVAEEAARAKQSHLAYLWALVESELDDRGDRRKRRRIRDAKFPRLKSIDDFNFEEASHIPAASEAALRGELHFSSRHL